MLKLQNYEDIFCKFLNDEHIRKIIEKLIEQRDISMDFIDKIKSQSIRFERVSSLLSLIYSSDYKIINIFLEIIQFEFPHLYTEITGKSGSYDKITDVRNYFYND